MRVEIESIAFGGDGIARASGKVYFVKGGMPGDILDIKVVKDKGSFAQAVISEILKPSGHRVRPHCVVFDTCGGCQLQSLDYQSQLREKEGMVKDALRRIGGFGEVSTEPIFGSQNSYGYRNRVTLSSWFYRGSWHVGYNQEGSARKVGVDSCPVADEHVNRAIQVISRILGNIGDPALPLEKVLISSDGKKVYITLIGGTRKKGEGLKSLVTHLARHKETENVAVMGREEKEFDFNLSGNRYTASPSSFIQANYAVNEAMIETVIDWAGDGLQTVIDLYSGIGNFAIPLARVSELVLAVEINRRSVNHAAKNAKQNDAGNIEFVSLPVLEFIDGMAFENNSIDLIVLDPPREGARDIVDGMAEIEPEKIIYVSCDPATLSRDLKALAAHGYGLEKVKPFDMFPQTYHVETIALLTKN